MINSPGNKIACAPLALALAHFLTIPNYPRLYNKTASASPAASQAKPSRAGAGCQRCRLPSCNTPLSSRLVNFIIIIIITKYSVYAPAPRVLYCPPSHLTSKYHLRRRGLGWAPMMTYRGPIRVPEVPGQSYINPVIGWDCPGKCWFWSWLIGWIFQWNCWGREQHEFFYDCTLHEECDELGRIVKIDLCFCCLGKCYTRIIQVEFLP